MKDKEYLVPQLKDTFIFIAWISGLLLVGGFSWSLTRPIRVNLLQDSINRVLINVGDSRRLEAPLPHRTSGSSPMGYWFSLKAEEGALYKERLFFFTLIADGTFLPCAAFVNSQGKVEEIMPLSGKGERALSLISPGIIKLYIRRIEGES